MNNTKDGVHTLPDTKGWVNVANGAVLSRHEHKANAVTKGRSLAKGHGTTHTIHRGDGKVVSTYSYELTAL
jgi:hypothetical protein